MGAVLTETSSLACSHRAPVQLHAGQSKLTVNGSKVLVDGDLNNASIACPVPVTQTTSPCQSVASTVGGVAQKLKVGGVGVLLDSIFGTTKGTPVPAATWSVTTAGQTKLTTL